MCQRRSMGRSMDGTLCLLVINFGVKFYHRSLVPNHSTTNLKIALYIAHTRSFLCLHVVTMCEAICKNGAQCSRTNRHTLEGKQLCTCHFKLHKMAEDNCSICMETMTSPSSIINLHCKHFFHIACLTKWTTQGNDTCPLCREPMDTKSLMTLNKSTLDYIGLIIYSLPSVQRQEMLSNIMISINNTYNMFDMRERAAVAARLQLPPNPTDPRLRQQVPVPVQTQEEPQTPTFVPAPDYVPIPQAYPPYEVVSPFYAPALTNSPLSPSVIAI